jgi:hypothetical protein
MVVMLTGYNRNSKFDLIANGSEGAQNLRIGPLLRADAGNLEWVDRSEKGEIHNHTQSIVVVRGPDHQR